MTVLCGGDTGGGSCNPIRMAITAISAPIANAVSLFLWVDFSKKIAPGVPIQIYDRRSSGAFVGGNLNERFVARDSLGNEIKDYKSGKDIVDDVE